MEERAAQDNALAIRKRIHFTTGVALKTQPLAKATDKIDSRLKAGPEQTNVVGPLVRYLVKTGWSLDQIVFGHREWRVPKSPSEATKRERGASFAGFPVAIVPVGGSSPELHRRDLRFSESLSRPRRSRTRRWREPARRSSGMRLPQTSRS